MKPINFINPPPPERTREVVVWYKVSCLLIISLLLAMTITEGMQWHIYRSCKKQRIALKRNPLHSELIKQSTLQRQELDDKKACLQKLSRIASSPKTPHALITTILRSVPTSSLISLKIEKNHCSFECLVEHIEHIHVILDQLSEHLQSTQIHLNSLAKEGSNFKAYITITKKKTP